MKLRLRFVLQYLLEAREPERHGAGEHGSRVVADGAPAASVLDHLLGAAGERAAIGALEWELGAPEIDPRRTQPILAIGDRGRRCHDEVVVGVEIGLARLGGYGLRRLRGGLRPGGEGLELHEPLWRGSRSDAGLGRRGRLGQVARGPNACEQERGRCHGASEPDASLEGPSAHHA
jgi:hypothetical protein